MEQFLISLVTVSAEAPCAGMPARHDSSRRYTRPIKATSASHGTSRQTDSDKLHLQRIAQHCGAFPLVCHHAATVQN
jgi:hypothetical protein